MELTREPFDPDPSTPAQILNPLSPYLLTLTHNSNPQPHQGRFDEAKAAYNAGLVREPNNATGIEEKAEVEQAARSVEQAKALMLKVG